jgi:LPS-assembly protein
VRLNASDPELDRPNSELAGELNFYPNERLSVRSNLQYDPSTGKMNAGNLLASYTRGTAPSSTWATPTAAP